MQSYSILKYFFPILIFFQYLGCDSYRNLTQSYEAPETVVETVKYDCLELKKYAYNGFYAPSKEGKLFKKKEGDYFTDSLLVSKVPVIDFAGLKSVSKGYDASGNANIQVVFTKNGTQLFKEYTTNNVGSKIAIIIKDELIIAPIINSEIPGGQVEISGSFTQREANEIYNYLDRIIQCSKRN